jgi:glutamate synthase (NADPH/NADH) small chain
MPIKPRLKRAFIPMEERRTSFKEISHGYSREEAVEEAKRCLQCKVPPCVENCPAHTPAKAYVKAIMDGNFDEAYRLNRGVLTMPCSLGRVCPAFCERSCTLAKKGEPIAIRDLKRAACDYGAHWTPPVAPDNGRRVAVIGAGPAGLTVANDLRQRGYAVTVLDRLAVGGGTLVGGIPTFRLPRAVLKQDLDQLIAMGVRLELGAEMGPKLSIGDLFKLGYGAVFIGVGAMEPKRLGIEGEDLKGVASASDVLAKLAMGGQVDLPHRISIIGCGNVAVDIARSSLRLGREATILYRRTLKEAPANEEEIHEAEEEGVKFHFLVAPTRILGEGGHVTGVECLKMQLGEPDASGRARPVPIQGTEFVVATDMVIPAVSQEPQMGWLRPDDGIELTKWSSVKVDEATGMSTRSGVFAGGDAVLGPSTVVQAIVQGHVAADGIHRYLMPDQWEAERKAKEEAAAKAAAAAAEAAALKKK